jgi:anti-sigma B factor antagonist
VATRPEGIDPDLEALSGVRAIPGAAAKGDLHVAVLREDQRSVVAVRGAVDLATCDEVWDGIDRALGFGGPLVIDLTETTFVDSSGMALLVRAQSRLTADADPIVVRGPSRAVRAVMEITGLDTVVTIEPPR